MKDNIPTKEVSLPVSKQTVKYYEWLLQSESDHYTEVLIGDEPVSVNTDGTSTMSINAGNLHAAKRYLIEQALVDFSYDQFDQLHPLDRDAISEAIEGLTSSDKKK